jgi:hypothetical protein
MKEKQTTQNTNLGGSVHSSCQTIHPSVEGVQLISREHWSRCCDSSFLLLMVFFLNGRRVTATFPMIKSREGREGWKEERVQQQRGRGDQEMRKRMQRQFANRQTANS